MDHARLEPAPPQYLGVLPVTPPALPSILKTDPIEWDVIYILDDQINNFAFIIKSITKPMEDSYNNYKNTVRAKMNNFIDQYAQPPPHPQMMPPQMMPTQMMPNFVSEIPNYRTTRPNIAIPNIVIPNNVTEIPRDVASPALDKVAQNLPDVPVNVHVNIPVKSLSNEPEVTTTDSLAFTIFCWILVLALLAVLGWTIYLAVTIFRDDDISEQDDEEEYL